MSADAKIAPVSPTVSAAGASPGGDFSRSRTAEEADRLARYRLVIEEGPTRGTFIYKTLDATTGEVVRQLPREEVVQMMEDRRYGSGAVIDTSA